uniref:two-partner secretion domain-containing protein n=1 Tax=Vreelandella populi TaxID=2498858 RepID=UPI00200BDF50
MNKHCYRLVFNKAKCLLVVVSEAGSCQGKAGGRATTPGAGSLSSAFPLGRFKPLLWCLKPLGWAILVASGLAHALPAQGQIFPDRSAPGAQRPHVLESANGTPQVNIQTPSTQGVSRNTYSQFDVDGRGAILNNSRSATQSQLGGWVQGNPNLATGEARVIVNEVNSRDPSHLRGHVEVAGRRAEVVIANPAGIHVDGAGFINASGTTLTTGRPEFRNGDLAGYRIEEGTIRISGDGLDTSGSDYTSILARAVEVQAGVWAEELEVTTGANRIDVDRQQVEVVEGKGGAPEIAIDVAHLGGMYAGKIHLLATERGVGVHHGGTLYAGEIVVESDGRIENRGSMLAENEIRLSGQDGVANHGNIVAEGDVRLAGQNDVVNHGMLRTGGGLLVTSDGEIANRKTGAMIAQGDIHLEADALRSDIDTLMAAGVRDDGTLGERGNLYLTAGHVIDASGSHIAAEGLYAQADTVTLRDSHTQASDIDIVARRGGIDMSGATVAAQGTLRASTPETLRTDDARVAADTLDLDADELSNVGGDIVQLGEGPLSLIVDVLDNTSGRLASNGGTLEIESGSLVNRGGELLHTGGGYLALELGTLDNADGRIAGNAELTVAATDVRNAAGILQGNDTVRLSATALNNRDGDIVAGKSLAVEASGDIDNTQGQWRAKRIDVA